MKHHDPRVSIAPEILLLLVLAAGCLGRSEESVRAEFDAYVAGANACAAASDCVLVSPDCPLGCTVAVRADRQADVEAKARALVSAYERGGRSCAYDCAGPFEAACVDARCALATPGEATADGGGD